MKNAFTALENEMKAVFDTMEDSFTKIAPAITDAKDIVTSKG